MMSCVADRAEATSRTGYDVVRILLGVLLLSAAALKGHQLATEPVAGAGLLDSRWFLITVVEFELFFGLWLLWGLYPKWSWAAALSCFALFAGVSLWKALSGEATCGCFGRVPVNPWYTFTLDTAAVAALLCWRPRGLSRFSGSETGTVPLGVPALGVMAVWLAVGVPAAVAMGSYQAGTISETGDIFGDSELVVLDPEKWIGKRFPLLEYIDIGDRLAKGKWTVVLYHHDCPECQQLIVKYNELARDLVDIPGALRVALVEMPPYGDDSEDRSCVRGLLSREQQWRMVTPATIRITEGMVVTTVTENPR